MTWVFRSMQSAIVNHWTRTRTSTGSLLLSCKEGGCRLIDSTKSKLSAYRKDIFASFSEGKRTKIEAPLATESLPQQEPDSSTPNFESHSAPFFANVHYYCEDLYRPKKENGCPTYKETNYFRAPAFSVDFLYLEAIEDSLTYAEFVPLTPSYTPVISFIDQSFEWSPGVRSTLTFPFSYHDWALCLTWMYLYSTPPAAQATDPNYGILAGLSIPVFGSNGNSRVQGVKGNWKMYLNRGDFDLKIPLNSTKSIKFTPVIGTTVASINQSINVSYTNYLIEYPNDNTPQKVRNESSFLGFGPNVGMDVDYVLPWSFLNIYLSGNVVGLLGSFNLTTTYKDLLGAPGYSNISIKESIGRFIPCGTLEAGLSFKWRYLETTIGWEGQIWWNQMRMNSFSTIVSSNNGNNLTFTGIFWRNQVNF